MLISFTANKPDQSEYLLYIPRNVTYQRGAGGKDIGGLKVLPWQASIALRLGPFHF